MKNSRKTIRVQPLYTILVFFISALFFLTFLITLIIIRKGSHGVWEISCYLLISLCFLACVLCFIKNIQFAIIDEEGISIRGVFYIIANVKWSEIYSIEEITIGTHESRGSPVIFYKWLVIHLQKKEPEIKRGGINKRNKPPWQILATEKNKELIQKYHTITKPLYEEVLENLKSNLK